MSASHCFEPVSLASGNWIKAGFHCHSTESDGGLSPEATVERYRELGYRCVCLTDHHRVTPISHLSDAGFLALDGTENGGDPDVIGVGSGVAVAAERSLSDRSAALASQGAFTIAAHPTYCAATADVYLACPHLHGMEILNAYCDDAYCNGYATELWDMVLGRGKRIWGVASDDAHLNPRKRHYSDAGRAWVQVQAAELSRAAVLEALTNGAFYATQGPEFTMLKAAGPTVEFTCTPVAQVRWRSFGRSGWVEYATAADGITRASIPDDLGVRGYVRVELVDAAGLRAWSNPFFLSS
jgi:hypothetical protein